MTSRRYRRKADTRMQLFLACLALLFGFASLGFWVYGVYLAFSVSLLFGIASFLVEPLPIAYGIAMLFWHLNLPEIMMAWIHHFHL